MRLLLIAMRVTVGPLCTAAAAMAVPAASASTAMIMTARCTPAVRVASASAMVMPAAPAAAVVMAEVTVTQYAAHDEVEEDAGHRHDEHDWG